MDSTLKFDEHILKKIKVANSMMGLIRRVFSHLSPNMFLPLYSAFVRTHLEYAQAVWSPRYKSLGNKLEMVQIRATKLVDGLGHLEYPERLKLLNLPTLKYRRCRGDMIELWKHFNVPYTTENYSQIHLFHLKDQTVSTASSCSNSALLKGCTAYTATAFTTGPSAYGTGYHEK